MSNDLSVFTDQATPSQAQYTQAMLSEGWAVICMKSYQGPCLDPDDGLETCQYIAGWPAAHPQHRWFLDRITASDMRALDEYGKRNELGGCEFSASEISEQLKKSAVGIKLPHAAFVPKTELYWRTSGGRNLISLELQFTSGCVMAKLTNGVLVDPQSGEETLGTEVTPKLLRAASRSLAPFQPRETIAVRLQRLLMSWRR